MKEFAGAFAIERGEDRGVNLRKTLTLYTEREREKNRTNAIRPSD